MVMLVTVYQRQASGWRATRTYYRFARDRVREIAAEPSEYRNPKKPRYECPGCLNLFTDAALEDHTCFGGAPGYPRIRAQSQRGRPKNNIEDEQTRQPD